MKLSKFQQLKKDKLKQQAIKLYRKGMTSREIGKMLGRSHSWVLTMVRGLV
jgi:transposase-like protein